METERSLERWSAVQSAGCSSRRPGFGSHSRTVAPKCLEVQLQGDLMLFLVSAGTTSVWFTDTHADKTPTHKQIKILKLNTHKTCFH